MTCSLPLLCFMSLSSESSGDLLRTSSYLEWIIESVQFFDISLLDGCIWVNAVFLCGTESLTFLRRIIPSPCPPQKHRLRLCIELVTWSLPSCFSDAKRIFIRSWNFLLSFFAPRIAQQWVTSISWCCTGTKDLIFAQNRSSYPAYILWIAAVRLGICLSLHSRDQGP